MMNQTDDNAKGLKHHGFPPLINRDDQILIMGSFPSVKSRAQNFYYMHPQNRFWRILSHLFEDDFVNVSIPEKTALLKKHHIALYDVIESCYIEGSKDDSIKVDRATDIVALIKDTKIQRIYLNGQTATRIFHRYNKHLKVKMVTLPSTSSANARYSLASLLESWRQILE